MIQYILNKICFVFSLFTTLNNDKLCVFMELSEFVSVVALIYVYERTTSVPSGLLHSGFQAWTTQRKVMMLQTDLLAVEAADISIN